MAIYHLDVNKVTRTTGRSSVAAAAYRSGKVLHDKRTGLTHHYGNRPGVEVAKIWVPNGAKWAFDRETLWNTAEAAENRKNSATAREWRVALPAELDAAQRLELTDKLAKHIVTKFGVVVDMAIHEPDGAEDGEGGNLNHHAHLLTTTRIATPEGLGAKTRELDQSTTSSELVIEVRKFWADACNEALKAAGSLNRVDHRTLEVQKKAAEARGDHEAAKLLDRAPQVHRGPARSRIKEIARRSDIERYVSRRNAEKWAQDPVKLKHFEADWAAEGAVINAEDAYIKAANAAYALKKGKADPDEISAAEALAEQLRQAFEKTVEDHPIYGPVEEPVASAPHVPAPQEPVMAAEAQVAQEVLIRAEDILHRVMKTPPDSASRSTLEFWKMSEKTVQELVAFTYNSRPFWQIGMKDEVYSKYSTLDYLEQKVLYDEENAAKAAQKATEAQARQLSDRIYNAVRAVKRIYSEYSGEFRPSSVLTMIKRGFNLSTETEEQLQRPARWIAPAGDDETVLDVVQRQVKADTIAQSIMKRPFTRKEIDEYGNDTSYEIHGDIAMRVTSFDATSATGTDVRTSEDVTVKFPTGLMLSLRLDHSRYPSPSGRIRRGDEIVAAQPDPATVLARGQFAVFTNVRTHGHRLHSDELHSWSIDPLHQDTAFEIERIKDFREGSTRSHAAPEPASPRPSQSNGPNHRR